MNEITKTIWLFLFVVVVVIIATASSFYLKRQQWFWTDVRDIGGRGSSIPIIPDVPRDAIPPLDFPKYETVEEAEWLSDNDFVVGVSFGGDSRAYPVKILNWHEIINETVGEQDVVVTYCPLCNSAVVFDRHLDGRELLFGNTGALYESAMVMYDRQTESYWYHVNGTAIKGTLLGKRLTILPSVFITWKDWKTMHPDTHVLSLDTGFRRNYLRNLYLSYNKLDSPPAFPVSITSDALPPKEQIVGIVVDDFAKAYPTRAVQNTTIVDVVGKTTIEVVGDATGRSAQIFFIDGDKRTLAPSSSTFWFAWFAAYTHTSIYRAP